VAALAIAPPPIAAAPMALAVTSLDLRFRMMSPLGWGADVSRSCAAFV
jgi:hypothetical protein